MCIPEKNYNAGIFAFRLFLAERSSRREDF